MSADYEGRPVTAEEAAAHLGFASVEEMRAWEADGCPVGRCANPHCWRAASWPHLNEPCRHCGGAVDVRRG